MTEATTLQSNAHESMNETMVQSKNKAKKIDQYKHSPSIIVAEMGNNRQGKEEEQMQEQEDLFSEEIGFRKFNFRSIATSEGLREIVSFSRIVQDIMHRAKKIDSTWAAVDMVARPDLYINKYDPPLTIEQRISAKLLFDTNIARALHNRYLAVRDLMIEEWKRVFEKDPDLKQFIHLSLGAGLWRSGVEALSEVKHLPIKAILIDLNKEVQQFSLELAKENHVADKVISVTGDAFNFPQTLKNEGIDQLIDHVDCVGLPDYFTDSRNERLFTLCLAFLKKGGSLLTGNVLKTKEQSFIEDVIQWKNLKFRTADEFDRILRAAAYNAMALKKDPEITDRIAPLAGMSAELKALLISACQQQDDFDFEFENEAATRFDLVKSFVLSKIRKI